MRVFAIYLRTILPFGGRVLPQTEEYKSPTQSHPRAEASLPDGLAITGGGGQVTYTGSGNLLCALEPTGYAGNKAQQPGFIAASRDNVCQIRARLRPSRLEFGSSTLNVEILNLRRRFAPHRCGAGRSGQRDSEVAQRAFADLNERIGELGLGVVEDRDRVAV